MRKSGLAFIAVGMFGLVSCAAEYVVRNLGLSGVSVTNNQANASWELSSVLVHYQAPATQSVNLVRTSWGTSYVLATLPAGATNVVWWAEQPVPFKYGDVVTLASGGGTGTVQVIQQVGGR